VVPSNNEDTIVNKNNNLKFELDANEANLAILKQHRHTLAHSGKLLEA
jgi:hypothetical protein